MKAIEIIMIPVTDQQKANVSFHGIICETDNIEKEIKELKAKGFEPGKIEEKPWGKFSWLKDPDGNGLCLHQK